MLLSSWSPGLVGLGLIAALQGAPSSGTGGSATPATLVETEPRLVELAGGMHLLWVPPDNSGQFAACVGLIVEIATADRLKRTASLVELELRRENLAKAFREKFGTVPGDSRMLDVLSGDVASLCVSVPKSGWESALSIVFQVLRPVVVTTQKCTDVRDSWRRHEALGALLNEDPVAGQLQALTWLGFPQMTASIPRAVEQSIFLPAPTLSQWEPNKPSRVTLTIAGDYSRQTAEKFVSGHPLVQAQLRGQKSRIPGPTEVMARPSHQFPRFARVMSSARKGPVGLFSWPISQLDEHHANGLNVLANLLERRLNHGNGSHAGGIAQCRLVAERGFGSFVVEIQTEPTLEIDALERRVFSAIEELRTASIDPGELQEALDLVASPSPKFAPSPIDQAWTSTQRTYNSGGAFLSSHAPTSAMNPSNIRRLVEQDLPHNNLAEMYVEAAPPRQFPVPPNKKNQSVGSVRVKSRNASAGRNAQQPMNRRGGRIYTVQRGESLQTIAHKYHVTIAEIIHVNGIQHPDQIRPGTVVVIPVSSSSATSPK